MSIKCVATHFTIGNHSWTLMAELPRSITDTLVRQFSGRSIGREFIEDAQAYYATLAAADRGDLKSLQDLIQAALQ